MIQPHGGKLVDLVVGDQERDQIMSRSLFKIKVGDYKLRDLENIAIGVFSPLEGFMNERDYSSVLDNMRLSSGLIWTIPVTLPVEEDTFKKLKVGQEIFICDHDGNPYAFMNVEDKFFRNKSKEAKKVFGTEDIKHPGIERLSKESDFLIGGRIKLLRRMNHGKLSKYMIDPVETRRLFDERGWKSIVAFQTRNPIHRSHEYIQKSALEICDGLFLNPLVGETKSDDLPAEIRMKTYEVMIENYYPRSRVVLGIFTANMYYAGPKEAVFHAICRKNYGCTHFIVGRDHAGVGNYYGTYDAQKIFDLFDQKEIGIIPLKFENAFYCTKCQSMATNKTCPHPEEFHVNLSGTKVREFLSRGEMLPETFTRPEISKILVEYYGKRR
ncbi:sulfate adenylyltransferase [Athalassotoga saccharophila]|nr:sulfate adenylyltransferase [Athalassotoga saccharophila]